MKAMGMKAARMGGRMEQAYPFRTRKSAIINVLFSHYCIVLTAEYLVSWMDINSA